MEVAANNSGLTFEYLGNTVANAVKKKEDDVLSTISKMGENPSTGDLLMMQQRVQQWTMMVQIQSTLVKEVSDAMKGVIQKAG